MPTMVQAGVYVGVLHYLKAVEATEVARTPRQVMAKMKEMPTDDPLFGKGTIRADGRKIHDMYLFEVKKPAESKGRGTTTSSSPPSRPTQAFRPLAEGELPAGQEAKRTARRPGRRERRAMLRRPPSRSLSGRPDDRDAERPPCSSFSASRRRRCSASSCSG